MLKNYILFFTKYEKSRHVLCPLFLGVLYQRKRPIVVVMQKVDISSHAAKNSQQLMSLLAIITNSRLKGLCSDTYVNEETGYWHPGCKLVTPFER